MLAALNSPVRREMLWLLWDRELPAGEIAAAFEVTAPTVSSHLAILRDAELVTMRVDGNFRRYRARRDTLRSVQSLITAESTKWTPEPAPREPATVTHHGGYTARIVVDVATDVDTAFDAFTSGERFGAWLGVPVDLEGQRFATTMQWGTRIRGSLLPHRDLGLILFRWDFEDEAIPVPGDTLTGFAEFAAVDGGTRIEVTQVVATPEQADFMHIAWGYVLGRYVSSLD